MIKEVLESKETINKSKFTVPLLDGGSRHRVDQVEFRIIFGKVRNQKIPFTDMFTIKKVVAVATGEAYLGTMESKERKNSALTTVNKSSITGKRAFRDFAETEITEHTDEREAIIQTIRDLSCNMYENTVSLYGVRPKTIFTQIMLGLIIGDTPPPPSVRGSSAPLRNVREAIQSDFIAGASSERIKKLDP